MRSDGRRRRRILTDDPYTFLSECGYNLALPDDVVIDKDVYYDPLQEAAFGTLGKLKRVAKQTGVAKPGEVKSWLEQQHAYTLHRTVRKGFPRNPYSVDNIMDVGECDLLDVQALGRHNYGYKYLLTVIDVFSKFLHMVPLKSKSGKDVISAFQSLLKDPRYLKPIKRRPVWVRTDKGKEFLNA